MVDYLLDGRVDACFVRLPIPSRLFEIVPLFMEQQVIALVGLDEIRVALAQDKTRKMPEFELFARIALRHLGVG